MTPFKSALGREILAFLADNSGDWQMVKNNGELSNVNGKQLSLRAGSQFITIAHEVQHLAEVLTNNPNFFRNVDFAEDHSNSSLNIQNLAPEFRAMRIQNLVALEFHNCVSPTTPFIPSSTYTDEGSSPTKIPLSLYPR